MVNYISSHNTKSKISVIIPVYNTEKYLRQCLNSVVGQTYTNIEIICVNDGSTDSSWQILQEYARLDPRVHTFSQSNSGQGAARNLGIDKASGDYITFIDSDDWYAATFCEKMLSVIEEKSVDFVICAAKVYDERRQKYSTGGSYISLGMFSDIQKIRTREDVGAKIFEIPVMAWGKIFRADFLQKNKIRFATSYAFEDDCFFIDIFLAMKNFTILKEPLVFYRINRKNSVMQSAYKKYLDVIFQLSYQKNAMERNGVYHEYEKAYLGRLFHILECSQKQIDDIYKEFFYEKARKLVLSISVSTQLWKESACISENYMLYKSYPNYGEWTGNRHKNSLLFLKRQILADKIIYYFCNIPIYKSYIDGKKKIMGIPLMRLNKYRNIQI